MEQPHEDVISTVSARLSGLEGEIKRVEKEISEVVVALKPLEEKKREGGLSEDARQITCPVTRCRILS